MEGELNVYTNIHPSSHNHTQLKYLQLRRQSFNVMTTPARQQYLRIKKQHQNSVLLFRMGDFYETFDDDARTISRELEIALTSREMGKGQRIPLAGIPYHSLDSYLARLIKKGYRVAICEQTSEPSASRSLLDREVVRVVTPGTVVEESILNQDTNNYLAAVVIEGDLAGLASVDITTSEFCTTQLPLDELPAELGRLAPAELIAPEGQDTPPPDKGPEVTYIDLVAFHSEWTKERLLDHFKVSSLEPYGCEKLELASRAAGAIVDYLDKNQKTALSQITSLYTYSTKSHMSIDPSTRRNLELFEGGRWGDKNSSLLSVLDNTTTSMGGRLLKKWLGQPLLDIDNILRRLDAVDWCYQSALRRGRLISLLKSVSDLERLINRVRGNTASPRDLVALQTSLHQAPQIRSILEADADKIQIGWLSKEISAHVEITELIGAAIKTDPPATFVDGGVIREEFSDELDELRHSSHHARQYIAGLEKKERARTGIKSLKVGYNKIFGYYIEVSKTNTHAVPDDYIRRQTLVGGERYITPEMKEYESLILSANERIIDLELSLFRQVCRQVSDSAIQIMSTASAIARVDLFVSFADIAVRNGYVRPDLNNGLTISIKQGRHPVVEHMLPSGTFVPNDTTLSNQKNQLVLLTGPNMAGKSTYLRQVAVIILMAQIGSFVPAESAVIGLVDRIFTRVGMQDDLTAGQSTFMVEMVETASILNHATPRSLVILDEIGRGTSTYDGLAIARSVAEYIHNHPRLGCKTLFATHYHELTDLADILPRAINLNVAVSEDQGKIIFLRQIIPGKADQSYGVQVARLAGLPNVVIKRAWEILAELEGGDHSSPDGELGMLHRPSAQLGEQLKLITSTPSALQVLMSIDIDSMTPIEAITKLFELQRLAKNDDLLSD